MRIRKKYNTINPAFCQVEIPIFTEKFPMTGRVFILYRFYSRASASMKYFLNTAGSMVFTTTALSAGIS